MHLKSRMAYKKSFFFSVVGQFLAAFAARLLEEDGRLADEVLESYTPRFADVKEYCAFADRMFSEKNLP